MPYTSPNHLIVVAAGSGLRMGSDLPKQFLHLAGRPILVHTLERFHRWDPNINIVMVMHPDYRAFWDQLCRDFHLLVPHSVVDGGDQRFHSVRKGLDYLEASEGIIGVHDGVRPLTDHEVITRCYREADRSGAAIPVIPVTDSMRRKTADGMKVVNRADYVRVQTPQCFRVDVLRKAYRQEFQESFTDDASVAEAAGFEIALVDGHQENLKVTSPLDLKVAEMLLS